MSKKTSELPPAGVGTESDLYMVVQALQNRKQTRTQLRAAILSAWQSFIGTFLNASDAAAARTAIGAQEDLSLSASVEAFLATPSSANLRTAVTDETGTGALVFGTTPTIGQPILNQPNIVGTTTNNNAAAGSVGEFISTNVPTGTPVSLTSGVPANVASISLTPGDWDVSGNIGFLPGGTTTTSLVIGAIGSVSATLPTTPAGGGYTALPYSAPAGAGIVIPVGRTRVSVAVTTTIYLITQVTFAVSTNAAYGFIGARRVR